MYAYDEGRVAERILIGAGLLGLAAGIAWVTSAARDTVKTALELPDGWRVRTVMAIGHPSEAGSSPEVARLARLGCHGARWSSMSAGRTPLACETPRTI